MAEYCQRNIFFRIHSIDNPTFSLINGRKMAKTRTNASKLGAAGLFVCISATWRHDIIFLVR